MRCGITGIGVNIQSTADVCGILFSESRRNDQPTQNPSDMPTLHTKAVLVPVLVSKQLPVSCYSQYMKQLRERYIDSYRYVSCAIPRLT